MHLKSFVLHCRESGGQTNIFAKNNQPFLVCHHLYHKDPSNIMVTIVC